MEDTESEIRAFRSNPSVGPWCVDFSSSCYETFMQYCNRRSQREKVRPAQTQGPTVVLCFGLPENTFDLNSA